MHEAQVKYKIGSQDFNEWFLITLLGDQVIKLGMPWLEDHNPQIDWKHCTVQLVNWSKERGHPLHQITQIIKMIQKEKEPSKIEDLKGLDEVNIAAALIDSEESWIRVKEMANYLEERPHLGHAVDDGTEETAWVHVKESASQCFTHTAEAKQKKDLKMEIPLEFMEYRSIFEKKSSERLPNHCEWDLKINLKPGFKKKIAPVYEVPENLKPTFYKWLNENLQKGYIRESESDPASGFFFVAKKQKGEYRLCMDYRYLNSGTIQDAYPLPLVNDLLLHLRGMKYFTKLNLRWGCNNVRIRKGDEHLAAFNTIAGLFGPLVMFFGLYNSPAIFQRMMNVYFRDMVTEAWVIIYMDDILICAQMKEELKKKT
jgi:hypothetical protein